MKKFAIPALLLVVALVAAGMLHWRGEKGEAYRFVEVARGDVQSTVTSTGILQAINTIQVGTQVSGKVSEIYVDFNDHVKKGQLIARIDPTLLEQAVRLADEDLTRARAGLADAQRQFKRSDELYQQKAITEDDYSTAKYNLEIAKAALESAQVNLDRAKQNLAYTEIRSPVDGVVIDRTVDVGQTVAASLSAPQLFLIAEDLSKMEILASVDESDIGKIHDEQSVRFTVQAYPDSIFTGTVKQVRLKSTIQENVVNYVVSIAVANPSGRLLPGMTATVDFVVAEAKDVLQVPNAALRFRPTEKMLSEMRKQRSNTSGGDSTRTRTAQRRRPRGTGSSDHVMLWTLDENGHPVPIFARTGISNGQYTEVTSRRLKEGMQIIASVVSSSETGA
ncbi:MAG TPA: efflux RND transporter periplasmic adaptor subunit, partial [Candidatus Krumholzibacteria bacterium]|nr:efflux RND transporter periplasmic adaptor subunit [Candidatus Krumholzibacteria bacterium]